MDNSEAAAGDGATATDAPASAGTATPGTAWLEYDSTKGTLTLHIFDAAEADYYHDVIGKTYEPMLLEIFE